MKTRHQFIEDRCSPDRSGQMGTGNPLAFAVHRLKDQRGVSAVIVAIVLAVLIGFAALAIDIGYLYATKNELQNIADAAALAGTNEIGDQWLHGETLNEDDIKFQIQDVSSKNQAGQKYGISILEDEIVIGTYDPNHPTKIGTLTGTWPDAVRVTARRTEGANGAVATLFAKIFNIDLVGVAADATAALTGQSTADEGEIELPVGISKCWYDYDWPSDPDEPGEPGYCDQPIRLYPTGDIDGCAGWHTYDSSPASAAALRDRMERLLLDEDDPNRFTPPDTTAGDSIFEYTGGNVASAFPELEALFEDRREGPIKDEDGNDIPLFYNEETNQLLWGDCVPRDEEGNPVGVEPVCCDEDENGDPVQKVLYKWKTLVVVYEPVDEEDCCRNPTSALMVAGFSTIVVHAVNGSSDTPHHYVFATVKCDEIDFGRPGGGPYGTIGSIAGLVE